jgi:hypothetical protein
MRLPDRHYARLLTKEAASVTKLSTIIESSLGRIAKANLAKGEISDDR